MTEVQSTHLLLSTLRAGPFISGVTHNILSLGQRPIVGAATTTACSGPCRLPCSARCSADVGTLGAFSLVTWLPMAMLKS